MGLTIAEILEEADERYPNALTTKSKLRKINLRESELYRTVYRRKTASRIDIVSGMFLYPLDFSTTKIMSVVIEGRKYDYEDINDDTVSGPWIYTYQNSLGLYPTPENDVEGGIFIHHWEEPNVYSEDNLNIYPEFDSDFHLIHVYGLCADMAEISLDIEVANGYINKYNGLLREFTKVNAEPELPPFRVE